MDLRPYIDTLRHELAVAAEAGGDDARAIAERLSAPLESATRLVLLEALSTAADEITGELAPGSVDLRLHGRDPSFVVTPPPSADPVDLSAEDAPSDETWTPSTAAPETEADDGGTSRINLRLPDSLKARIEEAASRERISVNAWLVRAADAALTQGIRDRRPPSRAPRGGQRYTGWVR